GSARVDLVRHDGAQPQLAHALLGQDTGDDDQGQQQRGEQVEQVVAGVHRGEAERQRRAQTPPAVASRPDGPPRSEEVPETAPRQRGTGRLSVRALMTLSAPVSPPEATRKITRWARAGTASALRSSGTRNSRPSASARARAARSSASEPRGLTPSRSSGERRVASTSAIR